MFNLVIVPQLSDHINLPDNLRKELPAIFDCSVHTEKQLLYFIKSFDEQRQQYNAADILRTFPQKNPEKTLIVTSVDLYIPIFTYVFGLAQLNGNTAIFSTHRLDPRFYGLPEDPQLLRSRSLKEAVHELGHLFGLKHCTQFDCVMASSATCDDLDIKSWQFCESCETGITSVLSKG